MSDDTKVWKDLLESLQDLSEENAAFLSELRQEIENQRQRNKKEVYKRTMELQNQLAELKDLLEQLEQDDLYPLEAELHVREQMQQSITGQLERTKALFEQATALLNTETFDQNVLEAGRVKTRSSREKNLSYHPKHFKESFLLGNWICYQSDNHFTCQSFWKDHSFKEYEFVQSRLISEKEGKFQVNGSHLILQIGNKKQSYEILGFNDDTIRYRFNGRELLYQYMPEELLNSFLEGAQSRAKRS